MIIEGVSVSDVTRVQVPGPVMVEIVGVVVEHVVAEERDGSVEETDEGREGGDDDNQRPRAP